MDNSFISIQQANLCVFGNTLHYALCAGDLEITKSHSKDRRPDLNQVVSHGDASHSISGQLKAASRYTGVALNGNMNAKHHHRQWQDLKHIQLFVLGSYQRSIERFQTCILYVITSASISHIPANQPNISQDRSHHQHLRCHRR